MPKMLVWFLSVRCEVCGHIGTMTQLDYNARGGSKCPADQCTGHLLVVAEHERQVLSE